MRLSLCNEVIREMPFAGQCEFAASVGYDGLEIAPFTLSDAPHMLDAGAVADVRRSLSDAGMKCSGLHWLLIAPEGLAITSPDAEVRARTIDVMRRLVDLAAELGAETLVHGSPKQRDLPEGRADEARAWALECFAAAGTAADAAGVVYCVEPLATRETNFINSVAEAVEIVKAVGSPGLRTMVDCSATGGTGPEVVALLDEWLPTGMLAHVQVNDPNRRGPGEGEMRFRPILQALRRRGYDRWVAVEPFDYLPDGPACAARAAGYLRGHLEGME